MDLKIKFFTGFEKAIQFLFSPQIEITGTPSFSNISHKPI
jgi:hypothetical protein